MKRIGLKVFSIGMLASVGLVTMQQGFAQSGPPSFAATGVPKCSVATLKGRYMFASTGAVFPPAFGVKEQSVGNAAGFHIFNGDGTGQDYVTATLNGVDLHVPSPNHFRYTVNDDCTGSYFIIGGGPTFNIFVSPDGSQMTAINTDEGNASSYTPSTRVFPK